MGHAGARAVLAVDFVVYMGMAIALAGWPYATWDAFVGSTVNTTTNDTHAFPSFSAQPLRRDEWGPSTRHRPSPRSTDATAPDATQTVEASAFFFASSLVAAFSAVTALPALVAFALPSLAWVRLAVLVYHSTAAAAVLVVGLSGRNSLPHPTGTSPQLYIWLASAGGIFVANIVAATMAVLDISGIAGTLTAAGGETGGGGVGGGDGGEEDEGAHLLRGSSGGGGGGNAVNTYEDDDDDALLDGEGTQMKDASRLPSSASHRGQRPAAVKTAAAAAAAADSVEAQSRSDRQRAYGTWKLLQLAQPHKRVLYSACVVLCIRLPFSLSMPHWVSQVIGALFDKQWADASWNIIYLAIAGTVDAALDCWAFYLFGLTQQRIIRDIRLDLFAAILRQEIGFFDKTGSGEITSRFVNMHTGPTTRSQHRKLTGAPPHARAPVRGRGALLRLVYYADMCVPLLFVGGVIQSHNTTTQSKAHGRLR